MIVGIMIGIVVACAVAMLIMMVARRSPVSDDGIADFRRHLNALSPEARRPVAEALKKEEDREANDGA